MLERMASNPISLSCAGVSDLMLPFVAQGMNAGVLIRPWGVWSIPSLAFEVVS